MTRFAKHARQQKAAISRLRDLTNPRTLGLSSAQVTGDISSLSALTNLQEFPPR